MGKVSESVQALVTPIAESFGLEVVEVLYKKEYDGHESYNCHRQGRRSYH